MYNLRNTAKAKLSRRFITVKVFIRKENGLKYNELSIYIKELTRQAVK